MHNLAFPLSIQRLAVYYALLPAKYQHGPLRLNIKSIDLFPDIFDNKLFLESYLKLTLIPAYLIHIHLFRLSLTCKKAYLIVKCDHH